MKRLSQKLRDRTRTFARQAAAALCRWAPPGAAFVLEDLRLPARQPARREQAEGRLTGWFHGLLGRCIEEKAQERGIPLTAVHPAFTSRNCSRCGARGRRRRHRFVCPECGHAEHADVNAARNIRNAVDNLGDAAGNIRNGAPAQAGPWKTGLDLSDLSWHGQPRLAVPGRAASASPEAPSAVPRGTRLSGQAASGAEPVFVMALDEAAADMDQPCDGMSGNTLERRC